MKKRAKTITVLTLALALLLTQAAWAESDEVLKGIFDALTAEGSDYSQTKAMYMEYFPGTEYTETMEDDEFTLAVSGSEYMDGSWTFVRDGDCLAATFGSEDLAGISMALNVIGAVGVYYDMNPSLVSGYVNGVSALGIESE